MPAQNVPLDLSKDKLAIRLIDGREATYEYAGDCSQPGCTLRVFKCTSHPARADENIGPHLVVFAAGAPNEPPIPYCQYHDPHAKLRRARVAYDEFGNPMINGEQWLPVYQRGNPF